MNKGMIFQGQSLMDKTIEATGNVELSFETALLNGVSVTESFAVGQEVLFPAVERKAIVGLFNSKNRPASEFLNDDYGFNEPLGIGTMVIGSTFIVG
ncbi:hypothetical protein MW871_15095 [Flavobacterium sp. I-SCBP12n]|uniref:Uncharacterized protein n=1 Tax=Flavobacterium pygoscelis TaxID=2893176 RepID=A0A9X2BPL8_9FLAO|nr:hypothetical protein [Flavobacterium pygoscelis]MCK8143215.1 hypothetical protein [Flavobacterium pygoscelis]